jgi:hypothetical protein
MKFYWPEQGRIINYKLGTTIRGVQSKGERPKFCTLTPDEVISFLEIEGKEKTIEYLHHCRYALKR